MKPFLAVMLALLATDAAAQTYPSRPITIIAPTTAGGPPDTIARLLSEPMRAVLGQPIVVENVTGAGSTLGVGRVARCGARRLHAEHRPSQFARVLEPDLSGHLRRGERFRADLADRYCADGVVRPESDCRERMQRNWLPGSRPTRQSIIRHGRHRRAGARVGDGFPEHHRHAIPVRAVSRRLCHRAGHRRRSDRHRLHRGLEHSDASARRQAQGVRGRRPNTRWAAAPEVPTIEEAGVPGLQMPFWHAIWAPKRHAADVDRQAQRRCDARAGRSHGARAADADGPGNLPARATDASRRSPPTTRPRSRSGAR